MNKTMRVVGIFLCGVGVGAVAVPVMIQAPQTQAAAFAAVNHVGIAVPNFDEAMQFYTDTLGLKEAFTLRNEAGAPALAYLQVSRDTFIEIQPSTPERAVGVTHVGMEVSNIPSAAAALQAAGLTVTEPRSGRTGSLLANVTMPGGVRFELVELLEGSLPREASEAWDRER